MEAFPPEFLKRMRELLGAQYAPFLQAMKGEAVVSVRLNPQKGAHPPAGATPVPWCEGAYFLPERPDFVFDPLFHAGAYYVQEAASMLLNQMLELQPGMNLLDVCAAPGGKSTLLAGRMQAGSLLVANEVIQTRAGILAENLSRWGNPNCIVTQNDPANFGVLSGFFDLILVDAPCSGEGMFRKETASRGQWSLQQVQHCALRQKRILADVMPALAPGGQLIYSTCTFSQEENEHIIVWLLEEFGHELELDPVLGLEEYGAMPVTVAGVASAAYSCYPHAFRGEGFFICRLRKKGAFEPEKAILPASKKKKRNNKPSPVRAPGSREFLQRYIAPGEWHTELKGDHLFVLPKALSRFPTEGFRRLKTGILAGKPHRKGINPHHELALSTCIRQDVPALELSEAQALKYLKREPLEISSPPANGWILARYQGINLGWLKAVQGRLKNHFPTNWRIRKSIAGL
ncbi:MAG: hypothetical protein D6730_15370 [Bacteroidetes bacterium]|nr:MAG: hypothetical protein D6730_15370 [Bacteroidota bacterium]